MKTIIIDGYNLIHKIPELYDVFIRDMQKARQKLIMKLTETSVYSDSKVIIVFDSKEASTYLSRAHDPIRVIFSYPEGTADDVILNLVKEAPNPKSITVVSEDRALRANCKEYGAALINPEDFWNTRVRSPKKNIQKDDTEKPEMTKDKISFWEDYFRQTKMKNRK
jgi:predicted RNA-binding protein with PIN domain